MHNLSHKGKSGFIAWSANRGVNSGLHQFPYSHPEFRMLERTNVRESFGTAAEKIEDLFCEVRAKPKSYNKVATVP